MILTRKCKGCGYVGAVDTYPKQHVQCGKQYYRLLCRTCWNKHQIVLRAQRKNKPSKGDRTAATLKKRGLGQPGRRKKIIKSCLTCGLTMKAELFPRIGEGRYSAYCQPCKIARQRTDYAKRKAREQQRDAPPQINFNSMLAAFRPAS